tara:strand:- start:205 stop:1182 length:978 start_codon:yes stop_codon:yes gene_type:complete
MNKVWRFMQTYPMPEAELDILREVGELVQVFDDDPAVLAKAVIDVDAIIAGTEPITREVIESGNKLKVIGRFGAGVDSVDVKAATAAGIPILNTPSVNAQTVAEHTVALILAVTRLVAWADKSVRVKQFEERSRLIGSELDGKVLGIVGLGDIGSRVAVSMVKGFNVKLLVHTRNPDARRLVDLGLEGEFVSMDELVANSDIVSLQVPLNDSTIGLMSRDRIFDMKAGSYLVNTTRGAVVDEIALVEALKSGHLRGAGIDVYAMEPPKKDHPFFDIPSIVVTPHIASNSDESFSRMGQLINCSVISYLNGEFPPNCVNPEVYPSD